MPRPLRRSPAPAPKMLLTVGVILGILAVWQALAEGFWPAPFAVGLIWSLIIPYKGWRYGGGLATGVLGYGVALAVQAATWPLGKTANVVASIMGFGHAGIIVWIVTLTWGAILSTAGAWLGHAVRALLTPRQRQSLYSKMR